MKEENKNHKLIKAQKKQQQKDLDALLSKQ